MADTLGKRVHVEGRIRNLNESVFYNLDAIQRAILAKRKVSFLYFKYDENKKPVLQHGGGRYTETPVQLVYIDDFYYLVTWNDKHEGFANYRVDRMRGIEVSTEPSTKNEKIVEFDVAKYQQRVFGMFTGDAVRVTLAVSETVMSSVIDRFGKDVLVTEAEGGVAKVVVTVMEAPTFYGWLSQFDGEITLLAPESSREKYAAYLRKLLADYESDTVA